ncbi:unnamed protein product, partial [Polarella glacialis]
MTCRLEDIAASDGIESAIPLYLGQMLGIWSAGALVNWMQDDMAIDTVVDALSKGVTLNKSTPTEFYRIFKDADTHFIRATVRQLLDRAKQANSMSLQVTPAHAPQAQQPPTTSSGGSTNPDSVPTRLPNGRWSELLNFYNKIQLRGKDRKFPERTLLGAESVLARMDH